MLSHSYSFTSDLRVTPFWEMGNVSHLTTGTSQQGNHGAKGPAFPVKFQLLASLCIGQCVCWEAKHSILCIYLQFRWFIRKVGRNSIPLIVWCIAEVLNMSSRAVLCAAAWLLLCVHLIPVTSAANGCGIAWISYLLLGLILCTYSYATSVVKRCSDNTKGWNLSHMTVLSECLMLMLQTCMEF